MNQRPKLDDVETFIALAEEVSFSGASRALGISKAVVTRRIQRLEDTLRTQLVQRTTRSLKLTEEGHLYYQELKNISGTLRRAEERLQQRLERPVGQLKVVLPSYLGSSVITNETIPRFIRNHPDVSLEVRLSDLGPLSVPKDFDLLVMTRLSNVRLPDSTMRQRKLGRLKSGVFAAPSYLERCGVPHTPEDLSEHGCVSYLSRQWRFKAKGEQSKLIGVQGPVTTGSNEVLKSAVLQGCGITYSFESVFKDELASGRVVPLLEPWTEDAGLDLRLLMPGNDFTPLRVELFARELREALGEPNPLHTAG